ncbi:hypothetical protein A5320_13790 [Rheinheimera sp. SA_1]|nr:hypothetical protein A5320_13790 [Rheinheimera sp. SA_1]
MLECYLGQAPLFMIYINKLNLLPKKLLPSAVVCTMGALPLQGLAAELTPNITLKGKGEFSVMQVQQQPHGLQPWWQGGTGQLAYEKNGVQAGPQLLALQIDTDSSLSATLHGQWHRIPTADLGVTEAWLSYQPLPIAGYRLRARAGYFYPAMSLENTDTAWSSPYSSNFSVINSWLAEELRARGLEFSLSRPGRFFNSNSSWQGVVGLFQGNDPLGSIISWRGFASHPFQTNLGEEVRFSNYPSIREGLLAPQPAWVQPTRELDHRTGYYLGLHWTHQSDTELRLYHYDNNGDPLVFRHGQYAWDTQFQSLAWQQQLSENWRLVSQYLTGSTEMGPQAVLLDYQSWFSLLHYDGGNYRLNLRYDHWQQQDLDQFPGDDNNGNGHGWNISLQLPLSTAWMLALEWSRLNSHQANRAQWDGWPVQQSFQQLQLVVNWRFD